MTTLKIRPEAELRPEAERTVGRVTAKIRAVWPGAEVEHIGATSIPGALTKGDVDVVVRVAAADFSAAVAALKTAFAVKQPQNRDAYFASFGDDAGGDEGGGLPMGVQLAVRDSEADFFIFFRDYMRANPAALARYNELKVRHAGEEGDADWRAKDGLIAEILARRTGGEASASEG